MKERIKLVRKKYGLTQTEFGKRIGVKGNTITNYENGLRTPSDAVILSIHRTFDIDLEWLRTGKGDMDLKITRNQEIQKFSDDIMKEVDDSFKKRFINALSKLNESDWETLEKIVDELNK